ncbi:MAG: hypothetical protein WC774_04870 [Candidatus Gracilibacteria bacterium]|jgi:hypothetical protein
MINPRPRNSSEAPSVKAELAKIAEASPKEKTLAQTRQTVDRFAGVFALTGALALATPAMAVESPYVPLADASGKTQLVLKEYVKGKEELFAAFDKIIQSEQTRERKKNEFNAFSPEFQRKILAYYHAGKMEKTDEKTLLKGTNSLMSLYRNVEVAKQAISDFNAHKMPSQDPMAFEPMTKSITDAFPSGKDFIDMVAIQKIDAMIKSTYIQIKEQLTQEHTQLTQKSEQLTQKSEQLTQKSEQLTREIDSLKTLLKAL